MVAGAADALDDFIGAIYEQLTGDDPWSEALEKLRALLRASNMLLRFAAKGGKQRDAIFATGPKVDLAKIKDWEDHLYREVVPVSPPVGEVMMFQWEDVLQQNEMLEYMQRYDSSWTIVHCFDAADKVECLIIGSREREAQPFNAADAELLKKVGLHLRRAVRLRREYLKMQLTTTYEGEGLDRLAIGAFLADQAGHMMPLNATARTLVKDEGCLLYSKGALHAADEHVDRRLHALIREVLSSDERHPVTRAIAISRKSETRRLGVVVNGRRSKSIASGKPEVNALIFIRDVESAADLDIGMMQQLFSFTRAEARVAAGLARGLSLEKVERELNIRHNTARAHLRSMFIKAGVSRQAELVHLLANSVAALGSEESPE